MRRTFVSFALLLICTACRSQQKATVKEYKKVFTTYPFSDPNPVPEMTKIYPYQRFDGYTDKPVQKEWKVVELENDYIRLMILPEIGGKIWAAFEKSTGKSFIYYNQVVKFRDVAMRGPWTSGGIEANYGIIGHTPNCATPVDYTTMEKKDGSVSCVIGVLDLLTRTSWSIDINLPADKAYFTTRSFWHNSSAFEQPYYTWMNTGLRAKGNIEFIYAGTHYLGHEGEYSDWPINKQNGKNISFYENNNFGTYKSYHVFGKYTDFFGGYWHDEDFGMGRYSTHDDKAGKKIWIWGLAPQGMIWEKLLTDTDGQYVEVQSGRLFNQSSEGSTFTPFKHKGFMPHTTDLWTEYWFPVVKTKGFVAANSYGALNVIRDMGWLKIYFSPLQTIEDELKVTNGNAIVHSKKLALKPLQLFADSIRIDTINDLTVTVGGQKLRYESSPAANVLSRPLAATAGFDWNSAYGLYMQGQENIRQRHYDLAEKDLKTSLEKDANFIPSLTSYATLLYRNMKFAEALGMAKKALAIDTYDPAANYYYGIINNALGNITDAKDGLDIAAMDAGYRSASYTGLAKIYFRESNFERGIDYATKSIDYNRFNIEGYQLLALIARLQNNIPQAKVILDSILQFDPLNHFARFERYAAGNQEAYKKEFVDGVSNEMPSQTFLELAAWYYALGRNEEAKEILRLSPPNAEAAYWTAFLENKPFMPEEITAGTAFPFRPETAGILKSLIKRNDHWLLKYHLALIQWQFNDTSAAKELFEQCAQQPGYAPFYAARARFLMNSDTAQSRADLEHAAKLDNDQWRYGNALIKYYLARGQAANALAVAKQYHKKFPHNYMVGMQYIKALLATQQYSAAGRELQSIRILPYEGATDGRSLYKEVQLMLALQEMQKRHYKKALAYIAAARIWPENLGVGKPYESDIDERLEDWLAYQSYTGLNNQQAARQYLDKILSYTSSLKGNINPTVANLVSAWAMQKSGRTAEGEKLLKSALLKQPGHPLGTWAMNVYAGNPLPLQDEELNSNENYRILQKYITPSPGR